MKSHLEQLLAASIEIARLNKRLATYEAENAYLMARITLADAQLAHLASRRNVLPFRREAN